MDYVKGIKANLQSKNLFKKAEEEHEQSHDDQRHAAAYDSDRQTEGSKVDPSEYFDTSCDMMGMEEGEVMADASSRSIGYVEGTRLEGTSAHHSNALRSGQRLNRASGDDIENYHMDEHPNMSKKEKEKISAKHIINIFIDDHKMMEVTPEQLYRVRTMHQKIDEGASFSFNYNTLLMVASILAGLGLVSNSSATIIASMLVSPLMGPVIGLGK